MHDVTGVMTSHILAPRNWAQPSGSSQIQPARRREEGKAEDRDIDKGKLVGRKEIRKQEKRRVGAFRKGKEEIIGEGERDAPLKSLLLPSPTFIFLFIFPFLGPFHVCLLKLLWLLNANRFF